MPTRGKPLIKRSSKWPALERAHLLANPLCTACGRRHLCVGHHIHPVHLFPDLELDPTNIITLGEGGPVNCHFLFGHLLDWKCYNPLVVSDAPQWAGKIRERLNHAGA